jgi:hypothetical protein
VPALSGRRIQVGSSSRRRTLELVVTLQQAIATSPGSKELASAKAWQARVTPIEVPSFTEWTIGRPAVRYTNVNIENEYNLPHYDRHAREVSFNLFFISTYIRVFTSVPFDKPLLLGDILQCLPGVFKHRKILGSVAWSYRAQHAHEVFQNLRKAKRGDTVPPIDTANAPKADLRFIRACCRPFR